MVTDSSIKFLSVDTTATSPIHFFTTRTGSERKNGPKVLSAMVFSAIATYGLMLLVAYLNDQLNWESTYRLNLPFLLDLNVIFMFIVSFPVLVGLTISDDWVLNVALRRVQSAKSLLIDEDVQGLEKRWKVYFQRANIVFIVLAMLIGIAVAYYNHYIYLDNGVRIWIVANGGISPTGWVFLGCVALFYALVFFYAFRNIMMIVFLRRLVGQSELTMLPAHPDNCGGLRTIGEIGLRNQYALSVFGINILLLAWVSKTYLDESIVNLVMASCLAYLILGPAVFVGPLIPFRGPMLKAKALLLDEIALRLRSEQEKLRTKICEDKSLTQTDVELVERLRKVGELIDDLPVWPFDTSTLRRFVTAYLVPLIGAAVYSIVKASIDIL